MPQITQGERTFTVFCGVERLVTGSLQTMLLRAKQHLDGGGGPVLIFEDDTGRQRDFDFSGTADEVLARAAPTPVNPGRGRPKLGVISREVSLLPRHWEWLEEQPNGISAALRRLVDEARRHEPDKQRARQIREAASKVMWVIAGNLPGFEEASRALFAKDADRFRELVRRWPADVRGYLVAMVDRCAELEAMP